jgi:hypothetical protein
MEPHPRPSIAAWYATMTNLTNLYELALHSLLSLNPFVGSYMRMAHEINLQPRYNFLGCEMDV